MSIDLEPLAELIRDRLRRSGLDRRELGEILATGRNRSKTFHRLDQILRGEKLHPALLPRFLEILEIPTDAWNEGPGRAEKDEKARREQEILERRDFLMKRRGPHLWRRFPRGYHPNLITVLGPEFFLLVPLPDTIVALSEEKQLETVGDMARADFLRPDRPCRHVSGYLFRRSAEEVFEFSTDGRFERRQGAPAFDGPCALRSGSRPLEGLRELVGIPS